jgi:hypothetical protein
VSESGYRAESAERDGYTDKERRRKVGGVDGVQRVRRGSGGGPHDTEKHIGLPTRVGQRVV